MTSSPLLLALAVLANPDRNSCRAMPPLLFAILSVLRDLYCSCCIGGAYLKVLA